MRELTDKLILLCCCITIMVGNKISALSIVVLLSAITISSLNSYFYGKYSKYIGSIYLVLCILKLEFLILLPLIIYDLFTRRFIYLIAAFIIPFAIHWNDIIVKDLVCIIIFMALALYLKIRSDKIAQYSISYHDLQDSSKELSMIFEKKNKELMEKQDYELKLATLNERNRIAREIHDNVGHMLSRSILQVGALLVINKDKAVENSLNNIKSTLSEAMDNIRSSVHNLYDESMDLRTQINTIIKEFTFCPVSLDYDADNMSKSLKYCFIAIIREALSNIIKHSNATKVEVIIREHPAFFQLIINDNGNINKKDDNKGIGLKSMVDRVKAFDGTFLIDKTNGFKIFISIPKESENIDENFNS